MVTRMTEVGDDITLLKAFQQKEPIAEKTVFQRLVRPLCLYAEDITGHLGVAEDIVAGAMEKARGSYPGRKAAPAGGI